MPYPLKWIRNKMREVRLNRAAKREKYSMESLENQPGKRWYHHLVCFTLYVSADESLRVDVNNEPERTQTISEKYNISELFSSGDKWGEKTVAETKVQDEDFMIISLQKSKPAVIQEALNVNEVMVNF